MAEDPDTPALPIDWSDPASRRYAVQVDNRADLARAIYNRDGSPTAYSAIEFDAWEYGVRSARTHAFRWRMWVTVVVTVLLIPGLLVAAGANLVAFVLLLLLVLGAGAWWAHSRAVRCYRDGLESLEHTKVEARRIAMLSDAELDRIRSADRRMAKLSQAARLGASVLGLWSDMPH